MRLVADIGGTNSRVAVSNAGEIVRQYSQRYTNAQWGSLYSVLEAYFKCVDIKSLTSMVVAVAGPVHGSQALLTNLSWSIEADELQNRFGCENTHLLNDLTALGHAVPVLNAGQLQLISKGGSSKTNLKQSLVVGIGTGFNVSPVLEQEGTVMCPAIEAGHVGLPFEVTIELIELGIPTGQFSTVETLFSGRGFTMFCREVTGDARLGGAEAISAYGLPGAEKATFAVDAYSTLLGHLLSDLSYAYMPSAGIYLAGSVARAVLQVSHAKCVEAFQKPNLIRSNSAPSIWTIKDDDAALFGCAKYRAA